MDNKKSMIYANKFIVSRNSVSDEYTITATQVFPVYNEKDETTGVETNEQILLVMNSRVANELNRVLTQVLKQEIAPEKTDETV